MAAALVIPSEPLDLSSLDKRANDGIISTPVIQNSFYYFMDVKIGSEGKVFRPIADTGSPITWMPNTDDWAHKSTTLVNTTEVFPVNYVSSTRYDYGIMVKDSFAFGDGNADGFEFGYIEDASTAPMGVVGLSRWDGDHPNLPDSIRHYEILPNYLKRQETIDHSILSVYYNHQPERQAHLWRL